MTTPSGDVFTITRRYIPWHPSDAGQGVLPLGRHVFHDSRNLAYPYRRSAAPAKAVLHPRDIPILDQGQVGSCFPPGTRVRMADGSERAIEDVRLGERVVTAEGNTGRVTRTMLRDETGGLVRLVAWGHSHLRMTREHPVLTERGYVKAGDLQIGDVVAFPRYSSSDPVSQITVAEYVERPSHRLVRGHQWQGLPGRQGLRTGSHVLPEKITLDARFGRLIGLFLAEGNCDNAKAVWSLHINERDTLGAEIVSILAEYGAQASTQDLPLHNGHRVTVHGQAWSRLLSSLCGNGAGLKRLHPVLTAGPRDFLEAVFFGWLDGDGHRRVERSQHTGVTISHDLALGMYDIAQSLGLRPTIRHRPPVTNSAARTRRWVWDVEISGTQSRNYSRQDDSHVWRKVRELRIEDYVGPVYNLSVEGDESYVAEGVGVHNCTGNGEVGCLGTDPLFASMAALASILGGPPATALNEALALNIYSGAETIDGDGPYPPNDNGSSGPSAAKAAMKMGLISGYTHILSLADLEDAVSKGPVSIGINWYDCIPDGQRVLTSDLRWVPIEKIQVGDELVGFDECIGQSAKYRRSTVTDLGIVQRPVYEITTDNGTVRSSGGHLFVRCHAKAAQEWARADSIKPGDKLAFFMEPYGEDTSWEAGWLAGFFDGEGTVAGDYQLNFGQALGPTLDKAVRLLQAKGYGTSVKQYRPAEFTDSRGITSRKPLANVYVSGGYRGALRFLGEMRPERLLTNAHRLWEGKATKSRTSPPVTVQSVRLIGTEPVHMIGTSTKTLIVEGFLSHNCFDSPTGADALLAISPNASVRGGHEPMLRGVDPGSKMFFGDNSWGTSWGNKGSFTVSYDTMARLLSEEGDGTVSIPVGQPAPTPVPPQPTPVPTPTPTPTPVPVDTNPDDVALWGSAGGWATGRHVGSNAQVARALSRWGKAKGFS